MNKPNSKDKKPAASSSVSAIKKQYRPEDYVTAHISLEQVKDAKASFDILDTEGSGSVDPQQLFNAFVSLGFGGENQSIYQMLKERIEDDRPVEFGQFLKMAHFKMQNAHSRADIQKIFALFDESKKGRISALDIKRIAQLIGEELSEEEVERIVEKAQRDDIGYITSEEFYEILVKPKYFDE